MNNETRAGATPINNCDMCGTVLHGDTDRIILSLDGYDYKFDSQECLQTFQKLLEVYGRDFFLLAGR